MSDNKELTSEDRSFLREAIKLAKEAQNKGNLPIGAVITLDSKKIGEGRNSIWSPNYRPNRHAEIEALESVTELEIWSRSAEMTLYTTLEPCLMCLGAILIYKIGRIVYGSKDPHGGALCVSSHMPIAFSERKANTVWIHALSEECDSLSITAVSMAKNHIQKEWSEPSLWDIYDPQFNPNHVKKHLHERYIKKTK
jgi:tRNA(adenine34) deaminase